MDLVVIRIVVLVYSVIVHECAHGWAALSLGDPTARDSGRLTFNPLPHIDPVGSIVVPLLLSFTGSIMLGWAKPVPVDPRRLNRPFEDHPKVAAAGPASNLALALVSSVLLGLALAAGLRPGTGPEDWLLTMLQTAIVINVVLALFNLLPLPPLDGSWILMRFLGPDARRRYLGLHRYGIAIVVGFLLLLRYTPAGGWFSAGISGAIDPFFSLAAGVARLFS